MMKMTIKPPPQNSEFDLILAARNNDEEAFDRLYRNIFRYFGAFPTFRPGIR